MHQQIFHSQAHSLVAILLRGITGGISDITSHCCVIVGSRYMRRFDSASRINITRCIDPFFDRSAIPTKEVLTQILTSTFLHFITNCFCCADWVKELKRQQQFLPLIERYKMQRSVDRSRVCDRLSAKKLIHFGLTYYALCSRVEDITRHGKIPW